MHEILTGSLCGASQALTRGELSAVELCTAMLQRIDALDASLHSYARVAPDLALDAAARVDASRETNPNYGALAGIPLGIKDIIATADLPTNVGGIVLRDWYAGQNSTVAKRLVDAGAVMLGKHQTTEAACRAHHPEITAPVNPFNPDAWTGVSSSGSGVATAACLSFGSFGSDTGGSIRFPSHCCGTVGLKPTYGRVSRYGVYPLAETFDHIGPLGRTVADVALLYETVAGIDQNDVTTLDLPVTRWSSSESDVRGLRVGYDEAYCTEGLHTRLAASLADAVTILKDAGAIIVPVSVPRLDEAVSAWLTLCAAQAAQSHVQTYPSRADAYGPALRALLDFGRKFDEQAIASAEGRRQAFAHTYNAVFDQVDVFLSPVSYDRTPTIEEEVRLSRGDGVRRLVTFTAPANMSGNPTLSLPAGLDEHATPFGYQLVGKRGGEYDLFRAGFTIEQAGPWPRSPAAQQQA